MQTIPSPLDVFERRHPHRSGHVATTADYALIEERLRERPASLSERDIAVLSHFSSTADVQAAIAARDAALGRSRSEHQHAVDRDRERRREQAARLSVVEAPIIARVSASTVPMTSAELREGMSEEDEALACCIADVVIAVTKPLRERLKIAEARIKELEVRPVVNDGGVWESGKTYRPGDIVSHGGSGWLCRSAHVSAGIAPQPEHFRLFVKKASGR
jgi:Carbohydrate-binding module family 5/12